MWYVGCPNENKIVIVSNTNCPNRDITGACKSTWNHSWECSESKCPSVVSIENEALTDF